MVKWPFIVFTSARYMQPLFVFADRKPFIEKLERARINVQPSFYISLSLINSIVYAIILSSVIGLLGATFFSYDLGATVLFSFPAVFFVFLLFFAFYPNLEIKRHVSLMNRDLFFALKDLSLQVSSGVPIYEALRNVSKGSYGEVTTVFRGIVSKIDTGSSLDDAISKAIESTDSEYLRKTLWQILGALKIGGDLATALQSIVYSLKRQQQASLGRYLHELNLWVLIYLFVSATIPSLIAALSSVFSAMSGSTNTVILTVSFIGSLLIQIFIIEYVKLRRPVLSV